MTQQPEEDAQVLNLERFMKLRETTFAEVADMLDLEDEEPSASLPLGRSILLFDTAADFIFNGAVIMDDSFGFYDIAVGDNWLESAEKLEAQGFKQAENAERFTRPGDDFGTCIYLYPDKKTQTVHHYSLGPRPGKSI